MIIVLVNNAAIQSAPGSLRESFGTILSVNVISVAATMEAFLPLLQKSSDPRIINLSSSVGSISNHLVPDLFPPDLVPHYCISKSALNMLGVQFEKSHPEIPVQSVNPGYCKTEINDYSGFRDPKEGANVVIILAFSEKGKYPSKGIWETVGSSMDPTAILW
jgi:NAD(P)-dependent dehydrogenase (short-subunit alcohol dehydrogenase family)